MAPLEPNLGNFLLAAAPIIVVLVLMLGSRIGVVFTVRRVLIKGGK